MARIQFRNHPYTEGGIKNEPILITREKLGYFTYPDFDIPHSDLNTLLVSTPGLFAAYFELSPGTQYGPPDYHPNDEIYIVLEGELTQVSPFSGQAVTVKAGEALIMPKGCVHCGFNFGQVKAKMFSCSPGIVDDQLFPLDMDGKWNIYKRGSREEFPEPRPLHRNTKLGTIYDIGKWPMDFAELRKETQYLYKVSEEDKLRVVRGLDYPILMKISVSNDAIQVGEYIIPAGGIQCRMSEPDFHPGETCIFVVSGEMGVFMTETRETFKVLPGEAIYIPANQSYSMMNYGSEPIHATFVITPSF
ncbi:MAG: cupin domain-containing protein [Clostridiales bacterium]|nr:cupin domain-containing protein [Clostridiales bacterium]